MIFEFSKFLISEKCIFSIYLFNYSLNYLIIYLHIYLFIHLYITIYILILIKIKLGAEKIQILINFNMKLNFYILIV